MKAAMFDLGHTLIDYYNDWEAPEGRAIGRFYKAVVEAGANADEADFHKYMKNLLQSGRQHKQQDYVEVPLEKVLENVLFRYGMEGEEELVKEGFEIFYGVLVEDRKLIPGALEALEQ